MDSSTSFVPLFAQNDSEEEIDMGKIGTPFFYFKGLRASAKRNFAKAV